MSATTSVPDGLPSDPAATFLSTLGGAYYTDEAVFAREQEHIFSSRWFCAVRTGDLPAPGAFRTCQVARESILCVRGHDGQVRAFLNLCRHRGARLCPSMGRWGLPVNAFAVLYGLLMTINLAWPRAGVYGTDHWYFQYGAFVFTGIIVLVGLAYYAATQRNREPTAVPAVRQPAE